MFITTMGVFNKKITLLKTEKAAEYKTGSVGIDRVVFNFSSDEWTDLTKIAVFVTENGARYNVPLIGDYVDVPSEVYENGVGNVSIGVYGMLVESSVNPQTQEEEEIIKKLLPTNLIQMPIQEGSYQHGQAPSGLPTPTQWEMYILEIADLANQVATDKETVENLSIELTASVDDVLAKLAAGDFDGRGIVSVTKTATEGLVDTYTILYTDNTESNFYVTNGADGGTTNYNELENKPQINGHTLAGNMSTSDIGITIPTATSDLSNDSGFITNTVNNLTNYTLKTATGSLIALEINSSTYVVTLSLKDQDGNVISTDSIDLPLESVVVGGSYDAVNKKIVLTLENGNTVDIPVGDLVAGLQTEITSQNKLASDLVDDSNSGNKFVTTSEKTIWNAKYDKPSGGIPKTDLDASVQASLGKADTSVQPVDIANMEVTTNKVTNITDDNTNIQYPSAKAVNDRLITRITSDDYINDSSDVDAHVNYIGADNLSQFTTTGKNKIPFTNQDFTLNNMRYYVVDGSLYVNGTSSGETASYNPKFKENFSFTLPAGTYTLSHKSGTINVRVKNYETDADIAVLGGNDSSIAFTLAQETQMYIGFYVYQFSFSNSKTEIMISVSGGDYEPYTGGVPAPNPSYPQAVKSFSGSVSVVVSNKNLFDKNNPSVINGYPSGSTITSNNSHRTIYIKCEPNESYTVQKTTEGSNVRFQLFTTTDTPQVGSTINQKAGPTQSAEMKTTPSISITTGANDNYLCAWCYVTNDTEITFEEVLASIQIEKSSTATPYVAHEGQTFTLTIPASIFLGNIGTYKNIIFKNTKDNPYYNGSLIENAFYWKKGIDRDVFDGTEIWELGTAVGDYLYFQTKKLDDLISSSVDVACMNYFSKLPAYNSQQNGYILFPTASNRKVRIRFDKNLLSDVSTDALTIQSFKTWLSTHNTEVCYALATPTYTQITDTTLLEQLEALYQFRTYENITNITITGGDIDGVLNYTYVKDYGFGRYTKPEGGIPKTDLANDVQTSLGKADTALQSADIANMEVTTNKVTSLSGSSTDTQYPSAKCAYDNLASRDAIFASYKALVESNYNSSNKVITGSGQITDSLHYPNKRLNSVEGDSLGQFTTTGKNLFNVNDVNLFTPDIVSADAEGWITVSYDNSSGSSTQYYSFKTNPTNLVSTGQTYKLLIEVKSVSGTGYINYTADRTSGQTTSTVSKSLATTTVGTTAYDIVMKDSFDGCTDFLASYGSFTAGQRGSITFRMSVIADTSVTPSTFEYEPYTGGQASPSPSYPQPVKVLSGNVSIEESNKNILNAQVSTVKKTVNVGTATVEIINNKFIFKNTNQNNYRGLGWNVPLPTSGDITISYSDLVTISGTAHGQIRYFFSDVPVDNGYGINTGTAIDSINKYVTVTPTGKYLFVYGYVGPSETIQVTDLMVSYFSDRIYQLHEGQTFPLTIPANMPLGKIGTYSNKIFKNTKDNPNYNSTLTEGKWYWKKELDKRILDGSENWTTTTTANQNLTKRFSMQLSPDGMVSTESDTICNYFRRTADTTTDEENYYVRFFGTNNCWLAIRLGVDKATTLEEFKTWLSTHNTEICYVLATPTYTQITDTTLLPQLEALWNYLKTYKNITNITITGGDIGGVLDFDYYVDDRVAMLSDIADLKAYVLSQGANI